MFLYINWDVNPELFQLGPVHIRWYSFMFLLSFLLGLYVYKHMLIREGKPVELSDSIMLPVFLGTLLGARLGHCLFYGDGYFFSHPLEIFLPFRDGQFVGFEGLASHGAGIGIFLGALYYSSKNKLSLLWTMDRLAIMIVLAGVFIRLGNLMNSEIYGTATDLPWGFVFLLKGETAPKHPTQLYEAFAYLLIFIILYLIYLKKKPPFRDGIISGLFFIFVFTARLLIEFVKEVQEAFELSLPLNMGQILSIPFIIVGIILIWRVSRGGWVKDSEGS